MRLYQKIIQHGQIDAKTYREYLQLRLSGLVVQENGRLRVYNRIYQAVFNANWVTQELNNLQSKPGKISFLAVVITTAIATTLVMVLRWLGLLQTWELKAFDQLLRTLPLESADQQFLIIGADELDINQYGHPLPDVIMAQVLDKLQQYQPSAIGLDIVRDQPVPPNEPNGYKALNLHFQKDQNLITVCAFDNNPEENISPPPNSPVAQVGFVNLYSDKDLNKQDDTVRRYLLSRTSNSDTSDSPCTINYSLGWQLAYLYLTAQNIDITTIKDEWQLGNVITKRLQNRSGGYQHLDQRGNQVLINYRRTIDPERIAPQVTVRDVLSNNVNPALIKGKIVIIGVTAASIQDSHNTPFGEIRGLYIHAHAVSQILNAVFKQRPLLWWLPQWADMLWVLFWSVTGGVIVWYFEIPLSQGLSLSICFVILYGCCWFLLANGGWIPLIPSALALGSSAVGVLAYTEFKNRQY